MHPRSVSLSLSLQALALRNLSLILVDLDPLCWVALDMLLSAKRRLQYQSCEHHSDFPFECFAAVWGLAPPHRRYRRGR